MSDETIVADYRGLLTKTEQESQAEFDKAILTLSGGALGLSFAFIKDFIGTAHVAASGLLIASWVCWTLSSAVVLVSFFTSQLALRKAIRQLDQGVLGMERPGGAWDQVTASLNAAGLLLFLAGLTLMLTFLGCNLHFK